MPSRFLIFFVVIIQFLNYSFSQCIGGTIGITGPTCGCLAGCNLTSLGGPNCSPAVTGNCAQTPMSTSITVPLGCSVTVSALMSKRLPNCTASGMDGGDFLKVDISGGSKPQLTAGGDATVSDSYTLVGPGTIVVSGSANRADEIITYTVTSVSSGGTFTCPNCISNLPIELIEFTAEKLEKRVQLHWSTNSEKNNDYFTVEKSLNGKDFVIVGTLNGMGTAQSINRYTLVDSEPFHGISYYRLKQTDFNGEFIYSDLVAVNFKEKEKFELVPNPASDFVLITGTKIEKCTISVIDATGQLMKFNSTLTEGGILISTKNFSRGAYMIKITSLENNYFEKLIVD